MDIKEDQMVGKRLGEVQCTAVHVPKHSQYDSQVSLENTAQNSNSNSLINLQPKQLSWLTTS